MDDDGKEKKRKRSIEAAAARSAEKYNYRSWHFRFFLGILSLILCWWWFPVNARERERKIPRLYFLASLSFWSLSGVSHGSKQRERQRQPHNQLRLFVNNAGMAGSRKEEGVNSGFGRRNFRSIRGDWRPVRI